MLPNINPALYRKFKAEGYRITKYKSSPVLIESEIVRLAYLDVNRTLRNVQPQQSSRFRQTAIAFIRKVLRVSPANQQDFDGLHREACEQCLSHSSPQGATIYYGQAQKLINMSLKYLYNEFAIDCGRVNHFGFPDGVEQFFHLPTDNQIRGCLVESCHFIVPRTVPWSQWTYEHYIAFQQQVRNRLTSPYKSLEVDYLLWNANGAVSELLSSLFP